MPATYALLTMPGADKWAVHFYPYMDGEYWTLLMLIKSQQ